MWIGEDFNVDPYVGNQPPSAAKQLELPFAGSNDIQPLDSPNVSISSPNATMRVKANISGTYVNPLDNQIVSTGETLAADGGFERQQVFVRSTEIEFLRDSPQQLEEAHRAEVVRKYHRWPKSQRNPSSVLFFRLLFFLQCAGAGLGTLPTIRWSAPRPQSRADVSQLVGSDPTFQINLDASPEIHFPDFDSYWVEPSNAPIELSPELRALLVAAYPAA